MDMEPFVLTNAAGKPAYMTIERWERQFPLVNAGFTTRIGGVSEGGCSSLNCALHVNDDPRHVRRNRELLAEALQIPIESWTCGEQVHGSRVTAVTAKDRGRGAASREAAFPDTDALITNVPGIWLTSFYADCVPLYFYDPVRQAVGLAHAGWKGTVLQIAAETIKAMNENYGSEPSNIRAAIGPSIGVCCYEVDDRVIERINSCLTEIGASGADRAAVHHAGAEPGKHMLNLQEMNRQIMIKAGILPMHIEICGICTGCRTDLFFSHRKENGIAGRMASWVGLSLKEPAAGGA